MKTIRKKYIIKASVDKLWKALVDQKVVEEWGAGSAEMSDKENADFKLWGGDIYGKNTKVVPKKLLVQDWYAGKWEEPSKATFTLKPVGSNTELLLIHGNVPDKEADEIDDGWDEYYLGKIKEYLEK